MSWDHSTTVRELLETTPINMPSVAKVKAANRVINRKANQFSGGMAPNKGVAVKAMIVEAINTCVVVDMAGIVSMDIAGIPLIL